MSDILMSQLWDATYNQDSMEKVASWAGDYLRDRIREACVVNQALPPRLLTAAELDNNTENDFPLKRVPIEPNSKAFVMGFRGRGEAHYFEGRKYEVWFNKFETQHFKKSKEELMTLKYPVMDVINDHFVYDLQEQFDGVFKTRLDVSCAANGYTINLNAAAAGKTGEVFKDLIIEGVRKVLGRRRRTARLIMTEARWMDLAKLGPDKLGYGTLVEQIAIDGVRSIKKFLGHEVITTINSVRAGSVWDDNDIYCITEPAFLGSHFTLGDINQEFKREGNMIEWYDWVDAGMEIGNVSSCCRIRGFESIYTTA